MFEFVVKYLGFLKHIPVLAHLFESILKFGTLFHNRVVLDYIDEIEKEVLSWKGTSVQLHKYGGVQFNVGQKELGHIHGNGLLDMLLTKADQEHLVKTGRVTQHHGFKNSGWISFYIRTADDKKFALDLLEYGHRLKKQDRVRESYPVF